MPCHEKEVSRPDAHGHHKAGSKGNECIACHMPMTRFAAMGRTDHSMRPPTPATTLAFKSPNACNLCHADHDAAWADQWVRKWYQRDYQADRAAAGRVARRGPQAAVETPAGNAGRTRVSTAADEVYKASLVRLLHGLRRPAQVAGPAASGCKTRRRWSVPVRPRPWPTT